jgi:hypothetical protein
MNTNSKHAQRPLDGTELLTLADEIEDGMSGNVFGPAVHLSERERRSIIAALRAAPLPPQVQGETQSSGKICPHCSMPLDLQNPGDAKFIAAQAATKSADALEAVREALRNLLPYCEWLLSDESNYRYPATLPSAIAAAKAALSAPSEKPVALVNDDEFENMVLAAMHTTMNSAAIKALTAMVATDGVEIERAAVSAINFAKEIIASASPHPGEANSSDGGKIDHGDNCPCPLCKSLRPSETNPQPVAWTDEAYTKARDCMVDILRKRSWCITERGVGEFDEAFQHAVGLLSLNATPPRPALSREEIARIIFDEACGKKNWDNDYYFEERNGCFASADAILSAQSQGGASDA